MAPAHLLLAVAVAAAWGFNFVVIKVGLGDVPPLLLSALRFTLASVPAVFFLSRPQVSWRLIVGFGATLGIVKFSLLFVGMDVGVPPGLASLVLQLQAFFTVLFAVVLLGEKLTRVRVAAMLVAFAGIGLLVLRTPGASALTGLLLVIGAAAAWGAANLLMKRCGPVKMLNLMVWASLVPPIPLFLLSAATEGDPLSHLAGLSLTGIGAIAYLAFVATLAGFAAWGRLLSLYPASQVAPFSLLVPIFGMSSSALLLGEDFDGVKLAAAGLVLAGLLLNTFGERLFARRVAAE